MYSEKNQQRYRRLTRQSVAKHIKPIKKVAIEKPKKKIKVLDRIADKYK